MQVLLNFQNSEKVVRQSFFLLLLLLFYQEEDFQRYVSIHKLKVYFRRLYF